MNVCALTPETPTVVFSLEMPLRQLWAWLLPMVYDLPFHAHTLDEVVSGQSGDEWAAVARDAGDKLADEYRNLYLEAPQSPTGDQLARAVDDIERLEDVTIERVFIDHLSLLAGVNDKATVDRAAYFLKSWAKDTNRAVIALQQTGRSGGDGHSRNDGHLPVTLSSGVYGGEAAADWIYGLYRPELDPKFAKDGSEVPSNLRDVMRFQVVKNRGTGEVSARGIDLHYQRENMRLVEPTIERTF
jgi:replicative DNA helicase